jgi:hypothetical protein
MSALKRVKSMQSTLGVAVGVVLTDQFSSLAKQWFLIPGVPIVFSLLVVAISVVAVQFLTSSLFDHFQWVRRLLLGQEYIEGTWFDILRKDGRPLEIGVSWLRYEDLNVKFSGEDCDLALRHSFPYEANMVQFDGQVLMYKYTARRSDDANITTQGYGEIQFSNVRQGVPKKYSGCYFVLRSTEKLSFEGFKLDEEKDREWIKMLDSGETRKKALFQLFRKYAIEPESQCNLTTPAQSLGETEPSHLVGAFEG